MTNIVPTSFRDLLQDETRAFAILGTTMPDGSPQATPIWFDTEDDLIRINSSEGRVKDRNMRKRKRIALTIIDPDNWYRYVQIRGSVVEITNEGAREHIDRLAGKYTGTAEFANPVTSPRVIYRIRPEHVSTMG